MSVKVRQYSKRGKSGWEVDIVLKMPDGEVLRERVKAPVSSKSGAKYWGEQREIELLRNGKPQKREVATLEQFVPRFLEGYVQANRQKPSAVNGTQSILRKHLLPMFGKKRLDQIDDEDIQRLKGRLRNRSVKTVNNVLAVLSTILKVAAKWKVTERMHAQIESLKVPPPGFSFYEFDEYEALVEAAERSGPEVLIAVLLGGDAGLRMGEMIALEQSDLDFRRRVLNVSRSDWHGQVTSPKGGRSRQVPMTEKLAAALSANRHLRGPRVLYRQSGESLSQQTLRTWLSTAQRRAGLPAKGALHILRHTFCSHLAMRNAPPLAIQQLAGHTSLRTTLRYMHLSPAEKDRAIRLLDEGKRPLRLGDILETWQRQFQKHSCHKELNSVPDGIRSRPNTYQRGPAGTSRQEIRGLSLPKKIARDQHQARALGRPTPIRGER